MLVGTSRADAAWTRYVNISKQQDVEFPKVAMDPAGDAVFVWQLACCDDGGIFARARDADGTMHPIQAIAPPGPLSGDQDVVVDSQGNAYFVWRTLDNNGFHVRTRVRHADGTLTPPQTLATANSGAFLGDPIVGVDASGSAVFAWSRRPDDGDEVILTRSRSPSGNLTPSRIVAYGRFPRMAVDSSGDATFAWEARASDDNNLAEFTRVLDSDGTLGPRTRLSRAGYQSSDGPIAVTPAGLAVFEWTEYKAGVITLLARARSSGGDLLAPQVLDTFDAHQPLPFAGLALAPTAESVFGWSSDGVLHARTRAPGGALGPVKTIAPTVVRNADIGIDSQGNQVFTWEALDAAGKTRIFVRSADSGGTLSPTKVVSLAGYNAHSPQVAVTPAGAAAVTWYEGNAGFAVQATFGP